MFLARHWRNRHCLRCGPKRRSPTHEGRAGSWLISFDGVETIERETCRCSRCLAFSPSRRSPGVRPHDSFEVVVLQQQLWQQPSPRRPAPPAWARVPELAGHQQTKPAAAAPRLNPIRERAGRDRQSGREIGSCDGVGLLTAGTAARGLGPSGSRNCPHQARCGAELRPSINEPDRRLLHFGAGLQGHG